MDQSPLTQWWALGAGLVLILVGTLGLTPNPIVGGFDARLTTSAALSIVHVATGLVALLLGALVTNGTRANTLIAFATVYALIFVLVATTPALFGLFAIAQNTSLNVIHFGMAAVSFTVGLMARASLAPVHA